MCMIVCIIRCSFPVINHSRHIRHPVYKYVCVCANGYKLLQKGKEFLFFCSVREREGLDSRLVFYVVDTVSHSVHFPCILCLMHITKGLPLLLFLKVPSDGSHASAHLPISLQYRVLSV